MNTFLGYDFLPDVQRLNYLYNLNGDVILHLSVTKDNDFQKIESATWPVHRPPDRIVNLSNQTKNQICVSSRGRLVIND